MIFLSSQYSPIMMLLLPVQCGYYSTKPHKGQIKPPTAQTPQFGSAPRPFRTSTRVQYYSSQLQIPTRHQHPERPGVDSKQLANITGTNRPCYLPYQGLFRQGGEEKLNYHSTAILEYCFRAARFYPCPRDVGTLRLGVGTYIIIKLWCSTVAIGYTAR